MTVDPVRGDQVFDQCLGVFAIVPKRARQIFSSHLLKLFLIHPLPAAQLPAIAAGGAKTNPLGFQNDNASSSLCQMKCCGQPGVTGPYDTDISLVYSIERGTGFKRRGCRGIPAGRIGALLIICE